MGAPCRQAYSETLLAIARQDPTVFVVCSDSSGSAMLGDFAAQLPGQFVEAGIAEQDAVGIGAGLANAGLKPFVTGPACFYSMRSAEQVKVDVAYSHSNVKVVGISGGVSYGALGTSHHSLQDVATMCAIPDLAVVLPADAWQTARMTESLVAYDGPVYVRMGRNAVPDVYGPGGVSGRTDPFVLGKANLLLEGDDVLVVSAGEALHAAYVGATLLRERGISAAVLDLASIMPLDEGAVLAAAARVRAVVTVEEHSVHGGIGSLVASLLAERAPRRMRRIAFPRENLVTGTGAEVFVHYGLTPENVAAQGEALLREVDAAGGAGAGAR